MSQSRRFRGYHRRSMAEARRIVGCHGAAAAVPLDQGAVIVTAVLLNRGATVVSLDWAIVATALLDRGATDTVTLDQGTTAAAHPEQGATVIAPTDQGTFTAAAHGAAVKRALGATDTARS